MGLYSNGYAVLFVFFSAFACMFCENYRVIGLCDGNIYHMCQGYILKQSNRTLPDGINIQLYAIPGTGDYFENIVILNQLTENSTFNDILVVFGEKDLVNAATTIAKGKGTPVFVFVTEKERSIIYPEIAMSLQPTMYTLGDTAAKLIREDMSSQSCVITESIYLQDGFLDGFWGSFGINKTQNIVISLDDDDIALYLKFQDLMERGVKVILVHISPSLLVRLIHICKLMDFFHAGFAWILSEISLSGPDDIYTNLPEGLLAIKYLEYDGLDNVFQRTLVSIESAVLNINENEAYSIEMDSNPTFREKMYSAMQSQTYYRNSSGLSFETLGDIVSRTNTTFELLNWDCPDDKESGCWNEIGYLVYRNTEINPISWPWNSLFTPLTGLRTVYRIITRPVSPFVFTKGPVDYSESCYGDTVCIKILTGNAIYLHYSIEDMKTFNNSYVTFDYYCCSGIIVDILETLATDLDFDFLLYFLNEDAQSYNSTDVYGELIQSVVSGSADILAGAVSVNSDRATEIAFTEPFYFSGFSMVVPVQGFKPSMDAFTAPFDAQVWATIFLSATIVAIATSLFEWNSPFGLNPWGRKRSKNYTLGSSLVMVYSVLFGHTVSTKSPKSWPGKVLQNFWAGLAIFIVASYTANLAAYLAGNTEMENIQSILDDSIQDQKLFARKGSASVQYIEILNKNLNKNIVVNEIGENVTITDIIESLRENEYDVFIEDRSIIEYGLTQHDNCTLKFAGKDFGEILYAFGLSKQATGLRDNLSSLILNYVESGFVNDISSRYIKRRECEGQKEKYSQRYGLEHTGGLFIMLLCAFAISGILLFLEHCVYRYLVPHLRKKPETSFWKKRNVEFFNQRLYRTIMSETLVSPQQTAREMMKLMKDRNFARLFQKNELKEPKIRKRDPMKGLRFMNLTDSLLRTYRTQNSVQDSVFSTSSSANLYSIAENDPDERPHVSFQFGDDDCFELVDEKAKETDDESKSKPTKSFRVPRRCNTFNYPRNNISYKRLSFFESRRKNSKEVTKNSLWNRNNGDVGGGADTQWPHRGRVSSDTTGASSPLKAAYKRYDSWPNMQKYAVESEQHSIPNKESIPRDIEQIELQDIRHNKGQYNCDRKEGQYDFQPVLSQDVDKTPTDNKKLISNKGKFEQTGKKDSSYYGRSLKMKDNRVKSTIRRHAMTKFRRHSSSALDEFAVDALSKEDLLVLWKKSEIELQTKLNRLSFQNAHLKKMLRIAEDTGQVDRDDCETIISSDLLSTRI